MKKRIKYILFILVLLLNYSVYAGSFNMSLNASATKVDEGTSVDVKINLNNIQDIPNGLNVCSLSLNSSGNVSINSVSGLNSWNVTRGGKVILDSAQGTTGSLNIANINVTVNGEGTISISGIECTDGVEFEGGTSGSSVPFSTNPKVVEENQPITQLENPNTGGNNNNNDNNNNNNNNNNSNDNVNQNPVTDEEKDIEEETEIVPEKEIVKQIPINKFEIVGYNINFNNKTNEYTIYVDKNVDKIYIIVDGENLEISGDKEISIIDKNEVVVTVTKDDVTVDYHIKIVRNESQEEELKEETEPSKINIILIIVAALMFVIAIIELIIILKLKNKKRVIVTE